MLCHGGVTRSALLVRATHWVTKIRYVYQADGHEASHHYSISFQSILYTGKPSFSYTMTPSHHRPTYAHITATRVGKPDWYKPQAGRESDLGLSSSPSPVGLGLDTTSGFWESGASYSPDSPLTTPESPSQTSNYRSACEERRKSYDFGAVLPERAVVGRGSTDSIPESTAMEHTAGSLLPYSVEPLQSHSPLYRPSVCHSQSDWHRAWYEKNLCDRNESLRNGGYTSTGVSPRPSPPAHAYTSGADQHMEYREERRSVSRGRDGYRHVRERAATPWRRERREE